MLHFSNFFFSSPTEIMIFPHQSINMVNCVDSFLPAKSTLHFWSKPHSRNGALSSSYTYCQILFARILRISYICVHEYYWTIVLLHLGLALVSEYCWLRMRSWKESSHHQFLEHFQQNQFGVIHQQIHLGLGFSEGRFL